MLSIAHIAGAGSDYYLESSANKSSYYLDGNSRTYWGGSAKDALGLTEGEIQKEDFDRLMGGFVGESQRIGNACKTNGWKHDAGRDFTFSDPKSVSILLQGPLRSKLLDIKKEAIAKAMQYGEQHFAKARIKGEVVGNQKMIWAAINEDTSRSNDPAGHAHIVTFNIVQGGNGKFTAMHNTLFYDNQVLLGQIYRSEIANNVKNLGFEIEPTGKYGQWEIKDISEDIRVSLSKRRQAILASINPDTDTAKSREHICLNTRPKKQNIPRAELLKQWTKELKEHGTSFEELSIPKSVSKKLPRYSVEDYVKISMNIIAETQEHIGRHDLHKEVLSRSSGHLTIDQTQAEIDHQISKGFLTCSKDGQFIARSIDLRRKVQVKSELQKGHLTSSPLLSNQQLEKTLSSASLKEDQKLSIRLLTSSSNRYVKIQGDAGVGKTYALTAGVPAIKKNGYEVIGLSTTSKSTEELEHTGVFDKVMTFQQYLLAPQGNKNTVLIIDESSMIGRDQMLSLLHYTNQKKLARVVFQGDVNQMSGVQAGMPFKDMEDAGVRSVTMNEIIRQKSQRHRKGVSELSRAELQKSFETLKPEIHEVSEAKMTDYAIKKWRESGDLKTPIIIQTNRQKHEINEAIKAQQIKKNPKANHLTLKTWQTIHKTKTEKQLVESYKDASHVRFNRDYKRINIKKGDIYKLESINYDKAELILSNKGETRTFRPARYKMGEGAVELYRQEQRTLHEGDRIKFTRGGRGQPVSNNQYGMVKSIKGQNVTFDLDKKTKSVLTLSLKDNAIRHIDHGWASTTHGFQGKTVDHAIVVMPSRKGPLTTIESLYTSASRHRYTFTLITDDANRLRNNIQKALQIKNNAAEIVWPAPNSDKTVELGKEISSHFERAPTKAPAKSQENQQTKDQGIDQGWGMSR